MADRPSGGSRDDRIAHLTRAYRTILDHYREIERYAREERELLRRGHDCIPEVNALLERKRATLGRIREEEERVKGAREWWKRVRRTLPAEAGSELLRVLDESSRSVERLLAMESECRGLLERRAAWGAPPEPSVAGAGTIARAAYGRVTTDGSSG